MSIFEKIQEKMYEFESETGWYPNEIILGVEIFNKLLDEMPKTTRRRDVIKVFNGAKIEVDYTTRTAIIPAYKIMIN